MTYFTAMTGTGRTLDDADSGAARSSDLVPGRVSMVVPCYNVEDYLDDFVGSIIAQSYKDIEVILVNDGANAATTRALRAAVPRLEAEGYVVILVEQENRGLAGAVNAGLEQFSGEFLMWPDPDDWLLPHAVQRHVELMRQNPDVGLIRANARLFIQKLQAFDGHFMQPSAAPYRPAERFEDFLFMRQYHAPVCNMARSWMFLAANGGRRIFSRPNSSQNFQMMVPLVEAYPLLETPSDVLAVYRVREDSRSRAPTKSHVKMLERYDQIFELVANTMPKLKTYDLERGTRVLDYYSRNRMLPLAIRGRLPERCKTLINRAQLQPWRKTIAHTLSRVSCHRGFAAMDDCTGRLMSRLLARLNDLITHIPEAQVRWDAPPLWAGLLSEQKSPAVKM